MPASLSNYIYFWNGQWSNPPHYSWPSGGQLFGAPRLPASLAEIKACMPFQINVWTQTSPSYPEAWGESEFHSIIVNNGRWLDNNIQTVEQFDGDANYTYYTLLFFDPVNSIFIPQTVFPTDRTALYCLVTISNELYGEYAKLSVEASP